MKAPRTSESTPALWRGLQCTVLAAALLAAGCATPPPQAAAGHGQPQAACVADADAAPAWWTGLRDPQLDALIEQGLADNQDLAQLAARLEQARAGSGEADAARRPRLDAAVSAARERVPRSDDRAEDGTRIRVPPYRQSRLSARLDASYEVDLLGRLREAAQSARARQSAGACDLAAGRRWVARELVLAYADLQLAESQLQANARAQELAAGIESAQAARLRAGSITREAWRQAQHAALELHDEAATLGHERELARARIAVLAGRRPDALRLQPAVAVFEQAEALSTGLPAALELAQVGTRPDVAAAWMRVEAAAAQAKQVRGERYPSLTLSGGAGFLGDTLRRWLRGEALAWVAEAALSAPVLDGGRADAREQAARAVLAEEQAAYRKTVLQAVADLGTALAGLDAGASRLQAARQRLQLAQADEASERARLRAGQSPRSAALQAQRGLLEAERSVQQQRHALLAAWVGAQQALGR